MAPRIPIVVTHGERTIRCTVELDSTSDGRWLAAELHPLTIVIGSPTTSDLPASASSACPLLLGLTAPIVNAAVYGMLADAADAPAVRRLRTGFQSLPRELVDHIFDLVVCADPHPLSARRLTLISKRYLQSGTRALLRRKSSYTFKTRDKSVDFLRLVRDRDMAGSLACVEIFYPVRVPTMGKRLILHVREPVPSAVARIDLRQPKETVLDAVLRHGHREDQTETFPLALDWQDYGALLGHALAEDSGIAWLSATLELLRHRPAHPACVPVTLFTARSELAVPLQIAVEIECASQCAIIAQRAPKTPAADIKRAATDLVCSWPVAPRLPWTDAVCFVHEPRTFQHCASAAQDAYCVRLEGGMPATADWTACVSDRTKWPLLRVLQIGLIPNTPSDELLAIVRQAQAALKTRGGLVDLEICTDSIEAWTAEWRQPDAIWRHFESDNVKIVLVQRSP